MSGYVIHGHCEQSNARYVIHYCVCSTVLYLVLLLAFVQRSGDTFKSRNHPFWFHTQLSHHATVSDVEFFVSGV